MMQLDRLTLGRMAKELGFVRDTLEKVCRLADVLKFMESDELLAEAIALKGGTAINLTIFDLPRLSVDIDLDYCRSIDREKMLADRDIITDKISKYMSANGYTLSPKSKNYHALDSFVYEYVNCGGVKDNIKLEINYMLRCHVLPVARRKVKLPWNEEKLTVLSVAPLEIFASKTVALLTRTAPRDLDPVLRKGERFDLEMTQKKVREYLVSILRTTEEEEMFWKAFAEGRYCPELIFGATAEYTNVEKHPMALWKCRDKGK